MSFNYVCISFSFRPHLSKNHNYVVSFRETAWVQKRPKTTGAQYFSPIILHSCLTAYHFLLAIFLLVTALRHQQNISDLLWGRVHQRGVRGHHVARKDHVGRPRACSKNNISMTNVFTLMNINTKIIESKLSKFFISEVCIKLVDLRNNRYTRSSS